MKTKLSILLVFVVVFGIIASSILATSIYAQYAGGQTGGITINANSLQQNISGFGGANIPGVSWRPDMNSKDRTTVFSEKEGMGFSVLRVRVPFNKNEWNAELPTIEAARSLGASIIATAWTAPTEMKSNNNKVGGKLKTTSYAEYAKYLSDYCKTVGEIKAISPFNEPNIKVSYESMEQTAQEVAAFVAAQGKNCGAPIYAPEPYNMDANFLNQYLSNSGANTNTLAVAGHIYGTAPRKIQTNKEVWMTEQYVNSSISGNDWNNAMNTAKEIHDCMNSGYSMYVWWYIKRYYGPLEEDGTITKIGHVMTHFAKFVRPGFTKVSCPASPSGNIFVTAYKKDNKLAIIAINQNQNASSQTFNINGMNVTDFNCYTTTKSANLAASKITSANGSVKVNLPGSSITTLVTVDSK